MSASSTEAVAIVEAIEIRNEKLENLENLSKKEIEDYKDKIKKQNHKNILEIRQVIQSYGDIGKIYLGGIPMIADDMMTFIKSDIIVFGLGVLLFIIATLWFVFRKLIWIIVPISSCLFSVVIMMGLLGILGWKVTVISSNFIALMLILTMAMNIHMSTRFLQLRRDHPTKNNFEIISLTTNKMFWPIIYTVFTTIFAFLSLIFSEIKPIIDFGWMMTLGLITSFKIKNPSIKQNSKVAIITRATLNFSKLFSFWKTVRDSSKAIIEAKGVYYFKGIGEIPFTQQATISLWDSLDDVLEFAYKSKAHAKIVKRTRQEKWYKEELFSRFYLLKDFLIK